MSVLRHPAKRAVDDLALLKAAARRYRDAVHALGEISPNKVTYFEESVIENVEAFERWTELDEAGKQLAPLVK